jgi:hypothetical protein
MESAQYNATSALAKINNNKIVDLIILALYGSDDK